MKVAQLNMIAKLDYRRAMILHATYFKEAILPLGSGLNILISNHPKQSRDS